MAAWIAFGAGGLELGRCEARTRGEAELEFATRSYGKAVALVQSAASYEVERREPPRRNNDDDQDGA